MMREFAGKTRVQKKKHLSVRTLEILVLAGSLTAAAAFAASGREVVFEGEPCPLTVAASMEDFAEPSQADEASAVSLSETEMKKIDVLGFIDDNFAAVSYTEKGKKVSGFVRAEELAEKVPAVHPDSFPQAYNWSDLTNGSYGDAVVSLQTDLIGLGYMEGTADGSYGPNTAGAVSAFQAEAGLEETGKADLFTWFLLREKAEGEEPLTAVYPPVFTVEEKYGDILSRVEDPALLELYVTPSWKYSYDVFEGEGEIRKSGSTELGSFEDTSRAIDRISLTAEAMVYLVKDNGRIRVLPSVHIHSAGAYRPYVKSILLRIGNEVCELPSLASKGMLEGVSAAEDTYVPLTEEAVSLLTAARDAEQENDPVILRVCGSSRTFDLDISDTVGSLSELILK